MKRILAFLGETLFLGVVVVLCVLIVAISKGYHPSLFGCQILRVLTQSMSPALEENSLILIREVPQDEIEEGDIITFVSDDPTLLGFYNTHRVNRIETDPDTGEVYYITKGDQNMLEDLYPVHYEDVAGELIAVLPFSTGLGRAMVKMADNRLYFFIVMLPLLLCLISYIWQILHILLLEDDTGEQTEDRENDEEE